MVWELQPWPSPDERTERDAGDDDGAVTASEAPLHETETTNTNTCYICMAKMKFSIFQGGHLGYAN